MFKVGDIVEAFGCRGEVVRVREGALYPVVVHVDGGFKVAFTVDGKFHTWNKIPNLKLIERPKRKVTKTIDAYMIISTKGGWYTFKTNQEAFNAKTSDDIGPIKLTGTYEVEVED